MYYYLVPYNFIVGKYETHCSIILAFDKEIYGEELFNQINKYFNNLYGETDRDGCVFFYDAGSLCIQLKIHTEVPTEIAMWNKINGGIPIVYIKIE